MVNVGASECIVSTEAVREFGLSEFNVGGEAVREQS